MSNHRSFSLSKHGADIERWVLNILFRQERLFRISLEELIDEQGYSYGQNGSSLFVDALRHATTRDTLEQWLSAAYETRVLQSFDDTIGRATGSDIGHLYFTPWEAGRVRPLEKFLGSGRAGPTPAEFLGPIAERLYGLQEEIRKHGFKQLRRANDILRVYTLIAENGAAKHVVRDGNHRASILSHMGARNVLACYESTHFELSAARRFLRKPAANQQIYLNIVRESEAATWPHVQNGDVGERAAREFFAAVFNRTTQIGLQT